MRGKQGLDVDTKIAAQEGNDVALTLKQRCLVVDSAAERDHLVVHVAQTEPDKSRAGGLRKSPLDRPAFFEDTDICVVLRRCNSDGLCLLGCSKSEFLRLRCGVQRSGKAIL